MGLDFSVIWQTVVGAGIGSAFINAIPTVYTHFAKRKDSGAYLAMRLIVIFEKYTLDCARLVEDNQNADTLPDQQYPNWEIGLPVLAPFPSDDEGWRSIETHLAIRCLSFPAEIIQAQQVISSTVDYIENEVDEQVERLASKLGLDAWSIAGSLRAKYQLANPDPVWDFPSVLLRAKGNGEA